MKKFKLLITAILILGLLFPAWSGYGEVYENNEIIASENSSVIGWYPIVNPPADSNEFRILGGYTFKPKITYIEKAIYIYQVILPLILLLLISLFEKYNYKKSRVQQTG